MNKRLWYQSYMAQHWEAGDVVTSARRPSMPHSTLFLHRSTRTHIWHHMSAKEGEYEWEKGEKSHRARAARGVRVRKHGTNTFAECREKLGKRNGWKGCNSAAGRTAQLRAQRDWLQPANDTQNRGGSQRGDRGIVGRRRGMLPTSPPWLSPPPSAAAI